MMMDRYSSHGFGGTLFHVGVGIAGLLVLAGCGREAPNRVQGYIEGEFVYIASPLAGALETLYVQRGSQVKAGDPLFALNSASEQDAVNEAQQRVAQARANLEDSRKGKRPEEIAGIEAQLQQARAALTLAQQEYDRQVSLARSQATSAQAVDSARATRDQDLYRVAQIEADLKTAQLGSRSDQIVAAEDDVRALEAALAAAQWNLSQKRQAAPQAGLVFDTLYRPGEWVAAGKPVISLLPPQNVKLRAFVSELEIGVIHLGDSVRVTIDGFGEPVIGRVSFISPQAEYTPPVIYSRENRSKLVFMIEATFEPETAATLHPGQPVDVQFGL
jgi:HlyD family secretion protein